MISEISNNSAPPPLQPIGHAGKALMQEFVKETAKPGTVPKSPTIPPMQKEPSKDPLAALQSLAANSKEMTRLTAHMSYSNQPEAMKAYSAAANMIG